MPCHWTTRIFALPSSDGTIFELVREDLYRACRANQGGETGVAAHLRELFNPGTQAVLAHRYGCWTRRIPVPLLRQLLITSHFLIEYVFAWRVGILIPVNARIGAGLVVHTWCGGIVLPSCEIGRRLTIIGGGVQFDYDTQSIGDEVWLGPGTKCVGKIRIGHRVRTAPNSVIQTDIPDDSLAFGNPARIVPARKWNFAPAGGAR